MSTALEVSLKSRYVRARQVCRHRILVPLGSSFEVEVEKEQLCQKISDPARWTVLVGSAKRQ